MRMKNLRKKEENGFLVVLGGNKCFYNIIRVSDRVQLFVCLVGLSTMEK